VPAPRMLRFGTAGERIAGKWPAVHPIEIARTGVFLDVTRVPADDTVSSNVSWVPH